MSNHLLKDLFIREGLAQPDAQADAAVDAGSARPISAEAPEPAPAAPSVVRTRRRRARRAPVVRRPARKSAVAQIEDDIADAMQTYEYGALLIAEVSAFILWLVPWLLNGFFTAVFVQWLVRAVVVGLNTFLASFGIGTVAIGAATAWVIGIIAHLVLSAVEINLWRSGKRGDYPTIVAVGIADVLTSALGVRIVFTYLGLPSDTLLANTISTIVAEAVAILPERRLVRHAVGVYVMLKRR